MKALVFLIALLPLSALANDRTKPEAPAIFKNECENSANGSDRQRNCLAEEKQREAQENFRDFQENNHMEKTL